MIRMRGRRWEEGKEETQDKNGLPRSELQIVMMLEIKMLVKIKMIVILLETW